MIFQPSNERRKSGSHYTPSSLTGPDCRSGIGSGSEAAWRAIRSRSRFSNLKVCDPAMGSGAFLVEACRQLGDALSEGVARARRSSRHSRLTKMRHCTRSVWSRSDACMAWTRTRWRLTWRSSRCGWQRSPKITRSPSSITRCARRFAGRTDAQADCGFPLGPCGQQTFLEGEIRNRIDRVSQFRQRDSLCSRRPPLRATRQELDGADESTEFAADGRAMLPLLRFSQQRSRNSARKSGSDCSPCRGRPEEARFISVDGEVGPGYRRRCAKDLRESHRSTGS